MTQQTTFSQEQAIARYAELMQIVQAGAYIEDENGRYWYAKKNIGNEIDDLMFRAAQIGMKFGYQPDNKVWVIGAMTSDEKAEWAAAQVADSEEIARQVTHEMAVSQMTRSSFSSDEA